MTATTTSRRRSRGRRPGVCPEVAALETVPARELQAHLMLINPATLTGRELVLYTRGCQRLANVASGLLLAATAEIMVRDDPDYGLVVDEDDPTCGRRFDAVGAAEVRGALRISRKRANSLCELAADLTVGLPAVLAALGRGCWIRGGPRRSCGTPPP